MRCFISSQIEQVCTQIATQFGGKHGFTRYDLFPFVLDDVGSKRVQSSYKSFATEILKEFDLERSSLATWTSRLVKHHRELNTFLLEHGVYMVSDWAILNDTSPKQLQQIYSKYLYSRISAVELQQACILLESYHAVYRRDRFRQRQAGSKGKCLPPTDNQLQQIGDLFHEKANLKLSPESIMTRLQNVAEHLRQHRISVRSGSPPIKPPHDGEIDRTPSPESTSNPDDNDDETQEFLTFYRQQFIACLDQSVKQVTSDRYTKLQRKNAQKAEQFITALELFHCQGRSMSEIAPIVGLKAQFQVTRLLQLKEFRSDIRQRMLETLRNRVLNKAITYATPDRLQTLDSRIEAALEGQVEEKVIQEPAAEASTANRPLSSVFAQSLCHYLNTRKSKS